MIINEVGKEYEIVFYCDIGYQIKDSLFSYLPNLLKFPLLPVHRLDKNISTIINDVTEEMNNVNMDKEKALSLGTRGFSAQIIFWITDHLQKKFISHWVDCAMHRECISRKADVEQENQ